MADEIQQQGSQPESQVSVDTVSGPNSAESQAVNTEPRQVERDRDYYNKTQEVASQRRAVEEERLRIEREKAELYRMNGQQYQGVTPPYGYQQPASPQQAPQYQPGYQQPTQADFSQLVDQFGYEGARSVVGAVQQIAQPILQQNLAIQQELHQQQITGLETTINLRGQEAYGGEWNKNRDAVMGLIRSYGLPLQTAWNAVTAEQAKQNGINQAYQNMNRKTDSNVVAEKSSPARESQAPINSVGDAFRAAMRQHS